MKSLQNKTEKNFLLLKKKDNLLNVTKKIPDSPGIYRYYDEGGELVYVQSCSSLRDAITRHLETKDSIKPIYVTKQIKKVDWVQTHGQLGAALMASKVIKKQKPIFNVITQKHKSLFTFQIIKNKDYLTLKIANLNTLNPEQFEQSLGIFNSKKPALKLLNFLIQQGELCHHINSFTKSKTACFRFTMGKCKGACHAAESPKDYNYRVNKILKTFSANTWPFTNKIAIKEICEQSRKEQYHVFQNWSYLATVSSYKKIRNTEAQIDSIDIGIYQLIKKYFNNEKNLKNIVEIDSDI